MVSLLSVVACHLNAVVAVGDTPDSVTTFQFSIGSAIYNAESKQMWTTTADVLSSETETIQKYGVSYTPLVSSDGSRSLPTLTAYPYLTPTAIISQINGSVVSVSSDVNPLYGKAMNDLTLLGVGPAVVIDDEPASIYYIQQVVFSDNARGITSNEGNSIVNKLDYDAGQEVHVIAGIGGANLLAARATGAFGSTSSVLSYVQLISGTLSGNAYSCLQEQASQPIAVGTEVLTAGTSDLSALGSSVVFYPSGSAARMYVGVDVTTAATAGYRGVGLFTAQGVNSINETAGSLTYTSIIDDAVVVAATVDTPVSILNDERIAIRNISTTSTSTGLGYVFAARDNGAGGAQSVYAMPMVTMPATNSNFGKIAAFDSVETVFKISGVTYRTQGFSSVLTDVDEIDI
ncbi:MAG: hypothetical protein JKY53_00445, partial [Flavobacteriales bacterium]|nr:hypothetical protein [Flavobacteriales bacterium]